MQPVTIGVMTAPFTEAEAFVRRYLTQPAENWAYPAYDGYPGGPAGELTAQDLFAPALLNAGISKLSSYYAFIALLPELNARLAHVPAGVSLGAATDPQLEAVADLIALLDAPGLPGIRLTKFSKVIHRKRPQIVPLYDKHIARCYQDGPDAPVSSVRGRTWRDFSLQWLAAVRSDLASQPDTWADLARLTPPDGPTITPLRALDIVGWGLGQPSRRAWQSTLAERGLSSAG